MREALVGTLVIAVPCTRYLLSTEPRQGEKRCSGSWRGFTAHEIWQAACWLLDFESNHKVMNDLFG